jgi:hypothetical protein
MDKQFTATLQKGSSRGAWTHVIWPESVEGLLHSHASGQSCSAQCDRQRGGRHPSPSGLKERLT